MASGPAGVAEADSTVAGVGVASTVVEAVAADSMAVVVAAMVAADTGKRCRKELLLGSPDEKARLLRQAGFFCGR